MKCGSEKDNDGGDDGSSDSDEDNNSGAEKGGSDDDNDGSDDGSDSDDDNDGSSSTPKGKHRHRKNFPHKKKGRQLRKGTSPCAKAKSPDEMLADFLECDTKIKDRTKLWDIVYSLGEWIKQTIAGDSEVFFLLFEPMIMPNIF